MLFIAYNLRAPTLSSSYIVGDVVLDIAEPETAANIEDMKNAIARKYSVDNKLENLTAEECPIWVYIQGWKKL